MRWMLLLVMVSACAPTLVKEGATQAEADRDLEDCRYEADLAVQGVRDVVFRGLQKNDLTEKCLRRRGYR